MTKDEALKMAIKYLNGFKSEDKETTLELTRIISTLTCVLEQPTEPRLVSYAPDGSTCTLNIDGEEVYFNREQTANLKLVEDNGNGIKTYEILPTHQWQGLTDDEIDYIWEILGDVKKFARAIEAKLKEKNHG